MTCAVCGADAPVRLWAAVDDPGVTFRRCLDCGSDTSDVDPRLVVPDYQTEEYLHHLADRPGSDPGPDAVAANVRWFNDYRPTVPGVDFLDVGHLGGAALAAMQAAGWRVHGFDVNPHADYGEHTTVAPTFSAGLFPRQYDAVLCREVVEHVPGWRYLLGELYRVTKPRGVCQVQTPRPAPGPDPIVYQRHHLQVFSPTRLEVELRRAGFDVCDVWRWEWGQAWLLRRPRG